jgi:site-specific recombinase XerD
MNPKEGSIIMAKKQRWAEMNKSKTPLSELRTAFRFYNQTNNKSRHTLRWYDDRLDLFIRFLGEDAVLGDLTIPNVRAFIADLQSRDVRHLNNRFVVEKAGKLSSSYIQGFARGLRAFSSWLYEDGYLESNVLKPLKPPKVTQKVIEVLSDADIRRLLSSFNRADPYGARNYAIVMVFLDCGPRVSEVCGLSVANARFDEGFLKVLGKGDKERLLPVGQATQAALKTWRDRFRPQFLGGDDPGWLFLNANGGQLTVNAVELMLRDAGNDAGIANLHPHKCRHTFATRFLTDGLGDSFQLQQLLGHTSLEMVRRYVSMAAIERVILERRASPMDRLMTNAAKPQMGRRVQAKKPRPLRLLQ